MKITTILFLILFSFTLKAQQVQELSRFKAPNATQAVAVDQDFFYTISNSKIIKRKKTDGTVVAEWTGPLKHLNSGIVIDDKLYCANTNYPQVPMASSLEIYDVNTMEHIGSHSFGIYIGSFTWIDKIEDKWYLMFVHYENKAQDLNRTVDYTTLIEMDSEWRRTAGWTIPKELVERLRPMSVSGGTFAKNGLIILSPHHFEEIYIFKFPKMGYELEWVDTIKVPFQGQGLAIDPSGPGVIYGIHRKNREVISVRVDLEQY